MSVHVLIATHQPALRAWLQACLPRDATVTLVSDGLSACQRALVDAPDVAIVGETLPHLSGPQTAAFLQDRLPACRILVLPDPEPDVGQPHPLSAAYRIRATALLAMTLSAPHSPLVEAA